MEPQISPFNMLPLSSNDEVAVRGKDSFMRAFEKMQREGWEKENFYDTFFMGFTAALMDIGYPRDNVLDITDKTLKNLEKEVAFAEIQEKILQNYRAKRK